MLRDREQGGRLLAGVLGPLRAEGVIVLGLARGGVPVALEVARGLEAPLGVLSVQRIGADQFPECTIGAAAEGGAVYVRRESLRELGITEIEAAELAAQATVQVARRARAYRGDAPAPNLGGRTVVLVDDGVATGATALVAMRAVRGLGAARVVLAAPVIAATAFPRLRQEFEEVVALDWPHPFLAVGVWYERFHRMSDEMAVECLRRTVERLPKREADRIWDGEGPPRWPVDSPASQRTEVVAIPWDGGRPDALQGDLVVPSDARGVVVFSTGSVRESPRYRVISRALHEAGIATLRWDLLSSAERRDGTIRHPLDPRFLTSRIATVVRWLSSYPATRGLHRGLYGSTGGAVATLSAVAQDPALVDAVVVRAGELDTMSAPTLAGIRVPVLLVVGSKDESGLSANRAALMRLATADLAVVPGATDLFHEPGALDAVARVAAEWFKRWLGRAAALGPPLPVRMAESSVTHPHGG